MSDYVSTLTGPQMDAALLDMAEHNSEAYAVGERNGIAVASDDVTYHNNARYYAQIASSQIVGDASSAVRWDTDQSEALTDAQKAQARENINAASDSDVVKITAQTLTSAEQSQARANIMAGGSNRNLLDNAWFTVRQRGNGPFTGTSIHSADRWKSTGGNPTVNLLSPYGIQIVNTTNSNVDQYLSYTKEDLDGKTVTLSVLSDDGITSGTGTFDTSSNSYTITLTLGSGKWYCRFGYFSSVHARPFIRIANVTANESTSVNIYAIKLELGSVSTLANDAPPKESQVTDDCKWYFQRIQQEDGYTAPVGFGIVAASTTILRTLIPLPSPLRKAGTLTATVTNIGQMRVQGNGSNLTPTAITGLGVLNGHAVVDITVNGTLTNNQFYTLVFANSSAIIDLSKDL